MNAIVAVYDDWGIGDGETQPIVLKADRRFFRQTTRNQYIVVGRKTLSDFPDGKPLKDRTTIVLSRTLQAEDIEGALVANSVEDVLSLVRKVETDTKRVWVCGGASVYEALLPYCDRIYVTRIAAHVESKSFIPNLEQLPNLKKVMHTKDKEENGVHYRIEVFVNRKPIR